MRLSHLTITGADDAVDPFELAALSRAEPLLEWGLLFDGAAVARPRFPSAAWRAAFCLAAPAARRSAHLCGRRTLERSLDAASDLRCELRTAPAGQAAHPSAYQRVQLNFDARLIPQGLISALAAAWGPALAPPMAVITQYNDGNRHVHPMFQSHRSAAALHAVLFDASGGLGRAPPAWSLPLPGLRCGYAGGLDPHNLERHLATLDAMLPADAVVWIDMESGVRSDDRFDLDKVARVIELVRRSGIASHLA